MFKLIKRSWNYLVALFTGKFNEAADPKVQLEQAILAQGGVDAFILPESLDLSQVPQDPNNPISPAKVLLGALLFHETGIGVNNVRPEGAQTYSCATCHNADSGFQANRRRQGFVRGHRRRLPRAHPRARAGRYGVAAS